MSLVSIILPDGSVKKFDSSPTILQVAESIGPGLAKDCLGGIVGEDKEIKDLRFSLSDGDRLKIITSKSPEGLEVIRHSGAHIMAQAVQEIFKNVKVTIGPVVDGGFYYDFDPETPFSLDDLQKIEDRMAEVVKRDLPITRELWTVSKAIEVFSNMGESFKVEIIKDLEQKGEKEVSIYKQGEWFDLCRGPHVQKTSQVKAVKVMSLAGAYWRGDQKNKQLQRVYGTAFFDKKDLQEYLTNIEEAKKRDHRKVGKDLGLFYFHDFSPGSPFFTPKGTIIYNELVSYMRELYNKYGYQEVITPQIYDVSMYKTSGHYDHYKENMYFSDLGDKGQFGFKPMNCPGHCLLYGSERRSYRELPWRVADFGRLHRYEASGALHGLTRVRSMSQDDAHIFCRADQMQSEIESFITFLNEVYGALGLTNYTVHVATRPPGRLGSDEIWDKSESALIDGLKKLNIPFQIAEGEGAFYGPKIEVHFVDAMKRDWQLGTLQVDFNMPKNFQLYYVGDDNSEHQPVMLHRAILGTLERFIGVFIEHCNGKFPLWLCPVQVEVMNVTDEQQDYCNELVKELSQNGVRAHFDDRSEKLGYKIREAQMMRTPYMLTIGNNEVKNKTVSLRLRSGKVINSLERAKFINSIVDESKNKLIESPWETYKEESL